MGPPTRLDVFGVKKKKRARRMEPVRLSLKMATFPLKLQLGIGPTFGLPKRTSEGFSVLKPPGQKYGTRSSDSFPFTSTGDKNILSTWFGMLSFQQRLCNFAATDPNAHYSNPHYLLIETLVRYKTHPLDRTLGDRCWHIWCFCGEVKGMTKPTSRLYPLPIAAVPYPTLLENHTPCLPTG